MHPSPKYLIHADIRTDGVVERSDVVGAIFGQTEGLLGEQLDLRDLQNSSKVGRIDVNIESEGGRSFGTVTVASGLDRVETAVLAASLETIERVGPCRADCTVTEIEDARAAKRRTLVERATELLGGLEERTLTSEQLVEEVRQRARVEEITEYGGFPAGPRVADSDAIIVVEGRADVRRLLKYGIKNAVAVEGTNVPSEIAELTFERNTTAFLDGDRGGDLILRELRQVADVDYVAFAPAGQSVEELDRGAILSALRRKVPVEQLTGEQTAREVFASTDGGVATAASTAADSSSEAVTGSSATDEDAVDDGGLDDDVDQNGSLDDVDDGGLDDDVDDGGLDDDVDDDAGDRQRVEAGVEGEDGPEDHKLTDEDTNASATSERDLDPETLPGHVEAVIGRERGVARFLDPAFEMAEEVPAGELFEAVVEAAVVPETIVVDGTLTQRLLDVAAQRGVGQIVAADTAAFVKQPTTVRVRTASEFDSD